MHLVYALQIHIMLLFFQIIKGEYRKTKNNWETQQTSLMYLRPREQK